MAQGQLHGLEAAIGEAGAATVRAGAGGLCRGLCRGAEGALWLAGPGAPPAQWRKGGANRGGSRGAGRSHTGALALDSCTQRISANVKIGFVGQ